MERVCKDCHVVVLPGRKMIRCKACASKRAKETKQDPMYKLWAKWYIMCKRKYPKVLAQLSDRDLVERVVARWGAQSVISEEKNLDKLTIVPFSTQDETPSFNDLVLVTKKECILLNKTKTVSRRIAFFPDSVQKRIQNKN